MSVVIGLDIGGSTTKVVGFEGKTPLKHSFVKASDPLASAYGALGKLILENKLELNDIQKIMVTGVGAAHIEGKMFGRTVECVDEFSAVGLGGIYVSNCQEAIVVSMGTGTSIVRCDGHETEHIIGSGVGGGTLLGLSNRMLNIRSFSLINQLAEKGDLSHVDLSIGDISISEIPGLEPETTASNFGKVTDDVRPEDLALGIVNMVFQSVGTAAILASRLCKLDDIVFVGAVQRLKQGKSVLDKFSKLYHKNIMVPENAEFATAIGAALLGRRVLNG